MVGNDRRVPNGEPEIEARAADRLIFFSDAVVAIAITLLAIDLPVPTGHTAPEFWTAVRQNDGHYAAFLISFTVIAATWSHHHDVFRYAERFDTRIRSLNMIWLLMIVLTPFATKLLTSIGPESAGVRALQFGFYALLQVLGSGAFLAMTRHMVSHHLEAADTPPGVITDTSWQSGAQVAGFGLSIPVFFLTPYAWVLWFAVPVLAARLRRSRRRNPDRPEPAGP